MHARSLPANIVAPDPSPDSIHVFTNTSATLAR